MTRGKFDLVEIARHVVHDNGFEPDIPEGIENTIPPHDPVDDQVDLRGLPWSSIDNEDSRDLDQIEIAEQLEGGAIRVKIGIADVDALAPKGSPVDRYAYANTCTLYTGVHIFPMLPEVMSTDRTSLLDERDRLAVITEFVVLADGALDDTQTKVYPARVRNHAKLVYENVGAWLEGAGDPPSSQPFS